MTADDIKQGIERLDDEHLAVVLRQLLLEVDHEPAVTEDEIAARVADDQRLIRDAAREAGLEAPAKGDPRAVLVAIADEVPEARPALQRAVASLNRDDVTLDFGITIGIGVLIVAVAGAILRPRFHRERTEEVEADGSRRSTETTTIELQGIEDVGAIVKELMPFLDSGGNA